MMIMVGTGGQASLQQHTGKSKCRQTVKKNQQAKKLCTLFDVSLTHLGNGKGDPRVFKLNTVPAPINTVPLTGMGLNHP